MSSFDDIRQCLIARIQRLRPELLIHLDVLLAALECGDSSTLLEDQISQSGDKSPHSKVQSPRSKDWPHAPLHRLSDCGTYMVTTGTLYKAKLFHDPRRLDLLEMSLLKLARQHGWQLEAWAVFSNHYHFVAHCSSDASDLSEFLTHLHAETAREINQLDRQAGRQVWHNYWDTKLTYEKSYLARLNYVHHNAVKHGLVPVANQYRWCSAAWFERTAKPAQVKTIYGFKIDKPRVPDEFDVGNPTAVITPRTPNPKAVTSPRTPNLKAAASRRSPYVG